MWDAAQKHVLTPRRALAQHFTSACQPQKQQGPAGSLKQCGLEDPIPASGGNVSLKMTIPNVVDWGDGLEIAYVSPAFPNLASAQKHACLELLCFLLVTAPTKVIMHPHEYLNQLTSIEQLRAQGQEVRVVYLQLVSPAFGGSTSGISMAERITDMLPRERPPSKRSTFSCANIPASCDAAARFGRRRVGCLCHQSSPRSLSPWAMVSGGWAPRVGLATFQSLLAQ